jgi:glutamate-ammonia-ligase adenylyltransferase
LATDLSKIQKHLSLLALRSEYQKQETPTAHTLQQNIDALISTLQLLYPKNASPEETSNSLLVLQRFLFAGMLRAKEFMQAQQAILSLQQSEPGDVAQQIQSILDSFVPNEFFLFWRGFSSNTLSLLMCQDEAKKKSALFELGVSGESELIPRLSLLPKEESSARFLEVLSQSPDPERSLLWALSLLEKPFGRLYFRFFCQQELLLLGVVKLTGLSESLSRLLLQNLDLLEAGMMGAKPSSMRELRAWQQQEVFRIVLAWITEARSIYETQQDFSTLAEACVVYCFQTALAESNETQHMAVIALGSLGGHELLYQSDLDLLFLSDGYEQEGCTRIAQRTIELLSTKSEEGSLYEVDTRLRPLGTQGPLVVSIQNFERYFGLTENDGPRAHLWEEQALLRARPLYGDSDLLSLFCEHHRRILQRPKIVQEVAHELRQMRQKIESEIPKRKRFYYKASSGGLQDIDFIAQFLQLTHGDDTGLLHPTTHQSLTLLSGAGLLSLEDTKVLLSGQKQWLNLVLTTRLFTEKSLDFVPENSNALRSVLRAQKFSSEEAFQKQLELLRGQVRACFDRIVH